MNTTKHLKVYIPNLSLLANGFTIKVDNKPLAFQKSIKPSSHQQRKHNLLKEKYCPEIILLLFNS